MRTSEFTPLEIGITQRITKMRISKGWSQKEFATNLKVNFGVISSVESYRTPVKLELAIRLARDMQVNSAWLVELRGPIYLPVQIDYEKVVINGKLAGSLAVEYEKSGLKQMCRDALAQEYKSPAEELSAVKSRIQASIDAAIASIPSGLLWLYADELRVLSEKFLSKVQDETNERTHVELLSSLNTTLRRGRKRISPIKQIATLPTIHAE